MISLASEMKDSKGRHARSWLFFDSECKFCTGVARWLAVPLNRRGLAVAPLQDPRVAALLGLSREELLSAIRFVSDDGAQYSGADAVLGMAREFSWARSLFWVSRIPGMISVMRAGYRWVAQHRSCPAGYCAVNQVPSRNS